MIKRTILTAIAVLLGAIEAPAQVARYENPSTAVAASQILCSGQCNVAGFEVTTGASAGWVLLFDQNTVPGDGAVTPVKFWQLAINTTLTVAWHWAVRMNNGAVLVFSTTGPFTKTASATATFSGEAR
jgi:hypothetical protein